MYVSHSLPCNFHQLHALDGSCIATTRKWYKNICSHTNNAHFYGVDFLLISIANLRQCVMRLEWPMSTTGHFTLLLLSSRRCDKNWFDVYCMLRGNVLQNVTFWNFCAILQHCFFCFTQITRRRILRLRHRDKHTHARTHVRTCVWQPIQGENEITFSVVLQCSYVCNRVGNLSWRDFWKQDTALPAMIFMIVWI